MHIHHLEFACRDLNLEVTKFLGFGFTFHGIWSDDLFGKEKIVLKKGSVFFLLHEDEGIYSSSDRIDNIAFEVEDIQEICQAFTGGSEFGLVFGLTLISENDNEFIQAAVITTPVGLKHTLIEKSNFSGNFLPNFIPKCHLKSKEYSKGNKKASSISLERMINSVDSEDDSLKLDHVALVVERNTTFETIQWYSKHLKMTRCKVNMEEKDDGFKVETTTTAGYKLGLRLTAMEYYFCSELSMKMPSTKNSEDVKLVIVEALEGRSHVDKFLKENNGPGIQHVGLLTSNIFASIQDWKNKNFTFVNPPDNYYNEIDSKIREISTDSLRKSLKDHGVLLDIEETDQPSKDPRYLLQVFTKPIFEKETFFFELIQRKGATGFGAGNISALWRSVDVYLAEKEK